MEKQKATAEHAARATVGMNLILRPLHPLLPWKRRLPLPRAVLRRRKYVDLEIHVQMDSVVLNGDIADQLKPTAEHAARATVGMNHPLHLHPLQVVDRPLVIQLIMTVVS